jgi:Ras-related protein Rab-6A
MVVMPHKLLPFTPKPFILSPMSRPSPASPPSPSQVSSQCKIVLLGAHGVGKTSIMNRFMYDQFTSQVEITMGVDYFTKSITVDDLQVSLSIWDTAGQEQYQSLIPLYIRDCQVAVIVYDVSDANSFAAAHSWYRKVIEERGETVQFVLAGNKSDLTEKVDESEVKKFGDDRTIQKLSVSAKVGSGINDLFQAVAREAIAAGNIKLSADKEKVVVSVEPQNEVAKRSCC